jgi:hypothetical protein
VTEGDGGGESDGVAAVFNGCLSVVLGCWSALVEKTRATAKTAPIVTADSTMARPFPRRGRASSAVRLEDRGALSCRSKTSSTSHAAADS